MSSIPHLAELLAENLPGILRHRAMTAAELDVLARLPQGMTQRLLDNDPTAYPCPRQWYRIQTALEVTAAQLLAEPS